MQFTTRILTASCLAALFGSAGSALAAVSADEAKQLGGSVLTAIGAEKAGNKEGTIPAYTGEGIHQPAGFDPKTYTRPDVYASEKPLFTITAQNAAQYADKLDGMIELFKKYPNFRMNVYPTHRTSVIPKWVQDNTIKNATACKGSDNDQKLDGCYGGYAFPIPKNGTQVMWNHQTCYEAFSWTGYSNGFLVASNGNVTLVSGDDYWQQSEYYNPANTQPSNSKTIYWAVRVDAIAPARKVGEKLVLLDPLDTIGSTRRAWQYVPGQRRVKLAPDLAYDTPSPTGGGVVTMDDGKVFIGALDRYNWKNLGKKEKFIQFNQFKTTAHDAACSKEAVTTPSFPNPDCMRWELHRVWHVEGKLKEGYRHIYVKRDFFWDEDNYAAGLSENYDASTKLYRVVSSQAYPFYVEEGGGTAGDGTVSYDLVTGAWMIQGSDFVNGAGKKPNPGKDWKWFSPEALSSEGIR